MTYHHRSPWRPKITTDITPQQLRDAAESAQELEDFLNRCGRDGVLDLIGFDLPWLAEQFDKAAGRLESEGS